ncbi:glycerol-3-phosphate responsive antiterminator [Bacillus sp. HMF5848]|uniref:glycerol-3-phosphate responsive antiterminator n=1 Tax=Bacillus sp. HMF5848 TaxID=2495421 RepID=UPI000F7B1C2A|nr:glycerol-3-phosphate responsive antiterminator [Bacillus sp. HMF5848]RSK26071.1 glycerol-3-phosphate responsive antiterminator [Bacillus sp. HMF5848]
MNLKHQKLIPAIRNMKDLEVMIKSSFTYGVFLDLHVAQVKNVVSLAKSHGKEMFLHVDMIHGLKSDEYATEFIIQEIKPAGIISTRGNVIMKAKQKGIISIQRLFLIDQTALEKSYQVIEKTQPDYIELLPGVLPNFIQEVREKTGRNILAGGLIRTVEDIETAIEAGAEAVTTSNKDLWKYFK